MQAVNYYLNVYEFVILFPAALLFFFLLVGFSLFFVFRFDPDNLPKYFPFQALLVVVLVADCLIYSLGFFKALDRIDNGAIKQVFCLTDGRQAKLAVWFSRDEWLREQICTLRSFDLESGRHLGRVQLIKWYWRRDYRIWGPFDGGKAWGYSFKRGLNLIDLGRARILADEKAILERNPQLGGALALTRHPFDRATSTMAVVGNQGRIFFIGPDLKAASYSKPAKRNSTAEEGAGVPWYLVAVKGTGGKVIHRQGQTPAPDALVMFKPVVVTRWGRQAKDWDRIWVRHLQRQGDKDAKIVSLLDSRGREIARLRVQEYFPANTEPYALTLWDGRLYMFFGRTWRGHYYSLTALCLDRGTGQVNRKIDYFK